MSDKPLIAAVHGAAIGGGPTMCCTPKFVYARREPKFQMPSSKPCAGDDFGSSFSFRRGSAISRAAREA